MPATLVAFCQLQRNIASHLALSSRKRTFKAATGFMGKRSTPSWGVWDRQPLRMAIFGVPLSVGIHSQFGQPSAAAAVDSSNTSCTGYSA